MRKNQTLLLNRDLAGKSYGICGFVQQCPALSACAFRGRINLRRERALIPSPVNYDGTCFMKHFRDKNIKLQRNSRCPLINNEKCCWNSIVARDIVSRSEQRHVLEFQWMKLRAKQFILLQIVANEMLDIHFINRIQFSVHQAPIYLSLILSCAVITNFNAQWSFCFLCIQRLITLGGKLL